jgi:hypothetical protein
LPPKPGRREESSAPTATFGWPRRFVQLRPAASVAPVARRAVRLGCQNELCQPHSNYSNAIDLSTSRR